VTSSVGLEALSSLGFLVVEEVKLKVYMFDGFESLHTVRAGREAVVLLVLNGTTSAKAGTFDALVLVLL